MPRASSAADRFWAKVSFCDHELWCPYCCWEWTARIRDGYGVITLRNDAKVNAHRFAWELLNTLPFPRGLEACHWCHNRPCVNPFHIYPGTKLQNMQHSVKDKRYSHGANHYRKRFSIENVNNMRSLFENGNSMYSIAKLYKTSNSTIWKIIKKRNWRYT